MWIAILAIAAVIGFGVYHNKHHMDYTSKTLVTKMVQPKQKPATSSHSHAQHKLEAIKPKPKKSIRLDGVEIVNLSANRHLDKPEPLYYQISKHGDQEIPESVGTKAIDLNLNTKDMGLEDGSLSKSSVNRNQPRT